MPHRPNTDPTPQRNVEIELKLAVHDPAVHDELAARAELGGYRLRPGGTHALRDVYWDTPARALAARRVALRLRSDDGRPLFTLKHAASVDRGLFRRRELELPATLESWQAIRDELRGESIELAHDGPGPDPSTWLASAGLEVTQDRGTQRRVLFAERAGVELAELALDVTSYQLGIYEVVFREIEVEALSGDAVHVRALGAALTEAFAGRLSPSEQGKYSRGLELAARLS